MWILAGQDENAFLSYLQNYPDPEFRSLLQNRPELERTINFLQQMMPPGEQPVSPEGIPHADINSSNIYGFQYDPKTSNLKVQFQGGSVYGYEGVPGWIFNLFKHGAVAAKTNGQNQY
ncbi:KTSC domain-containing protein, partial [Leclercia adecarboxylata]|uniref:KTSC domain-containing protein n=1 Tax=Leclercia adecarboxylata TaxID=83655 RepID=UPI00234C1104